MSKSKMIWIISALALLITATYGLFAGKNHVLISSGLGVFACGAGYLLVRKLSGKWVDDLSLASLMILAIVFGTGLNFYNTFWWWDVMLHSAAGIILAAVARLLTHPKQKMWIRFAIMFLVANGLGAIWEVYEYATYVTPHEALITDTITDLIANLGGSIIGVVIASMIIKNND